MGSIEGSANTNVVEKTCPQCNARFECKQAAGCWCAELPWTLPVPADRSDPAKGCLCAACLRTVLSRQTVLHDAESGES